jgi:hypothetical protein
MMAWSPPLEPTTIRAVGVPRTASSTDLWAAFRHAGAVDARLVGPSVGEVVFETERAAEVLLERLELGHVVDLHGYRAAVYGGRR